MTKQGKLLIGLACLGLVAVLSALAAAVPVDTFKGRCVEESKTRYSIVFGEKTRYDQLKQESAATTRQIDQNELTIDDGSCPASTNDSSQNDFRLFVL